VARAAGEPVVFLETPSFEWIVNHGSFWDVSYEHCNYISRSCLSYLSEQAGFSALRHNLTFGDQYQTLELRINPQQAHCGRAPGIMPGSELASLSSRASEVRLALERRLLAAGAERGWAVWGAGAKGVSLVNQLLIPAPRFVVDSNPTKQGCTVPGSDVPIVGPDDGVVSTVGLILVVNSNYLPEIREQLARKSLNPISLSI
jgi:hypothetical protein